MHLRRIIFLLCLILPATLHASETPAEHLASTYASQQLASHPLHSNLPDYSLPPEKLAQAHHLGQLRVILGLGSQLWTILVLIALLFSGAIASMDRIAVRLSRFRWIQAYIFLALFLLALELCILPLQLYGHHLSLAYGFSIQRWPGWFGDLGKSLALEATGGWLLLLVFWIIRRFPGRWWFLVWAVLAPVILFGVFAAPKYLDPIFNRFEPLSLHHPELVAQLEHMGVPASRQFLMKASAKVTTPNAYVTGLGNTKRIVVWDTIFTPGATSSTSTVSPEVLWTVGHECGHYALNHVLSGTLLTILGLLPLLFLAQKFCLAIVGRFGERIGIPSQTHWGFLAILFLASTLATSLTEPISNAVSRHIEHQADIYGEEAIHGLVPDPQSAVKSACDEMGLRTLDDPNPSPLAELWLYNHPATGRRAAFGTAYNPWAPGMQPKYFRK